MLQVVACYSAVFSVCGYRDMCVWEQQVSVVQRVIVSEQVVDKINICLTNVYKEVNEGLL